MTDEIGDRVRLAGARRPLHHDGVFQLQLFDDAFLFGIGALGEQKVGGLTRRSASVAFLSPDEPHERLRDPLQIGKLLDVGFESLDVALAAITEEEQRGPIEARHLIGLDLGERFTVEPVRPELVDERLEELAGGVRVPWSCLAGHAPVRRCSYHFSKASPRSRDSSNASMTSLPATLVVLRRA